MVQQRKKASTTAKRPSTAAAAPLLKDVADPAPFFSLGAAHFRDPISVTKVISVVLPQRHLRDKTILDEMVLKKLLHRSFEPSAEDLAQQQHGGDTPHSVEGEQTDEIRLSPQGSATRPSSSPPPLSSASTPSPLSSSSCPPADAYVIAHIRDVEIHADTARQINPQGDVQVNVMTTLVAARVQHGLIAGVAEASPFASCMQVRLPTVPFPAAVTAVSMNPAAVKLEGRSQEADPHLPSPSDEAAAARQLRVTARCFEDEPVVPGQAVLLVSEPAAMRCLAIRPPRDAPGPFFFAEDVTVGPTGAVGAARKRRTSRKNVEDGSEGVAEAPTSSVEGRRVVVIACDVPESAGKGDDTRKRPRL